MSFPRYPAYRDSGVEWLGKVPEHWEISRLGFETWVRARLGWKGLKAEEYVDEGFAFLSTPNIKGLDIDFDKVNFISQERFDESPEIKIRKGDVLLAKDGSTLGSVNVVRVLPRPTTVNSSIAVITPNKNMSGTFLYYLFASSFIEQTIQRAKGGMGVPHLFQADLNKFYIPLPALEEQISIAEFLDREIAKNDALVAAQRRLMELLQEKRQAIISRAINQGLNPDAPSKPSDIKWLGDIPAHWKILKIKHLVTSFEQGWSPQCEGFPVETEQEWGVLKAGCVNGGVFKPEENKALPKELEAIPSLGIAANDLLISRANTRELVGSAAVVDRDHPNLLLCDKLFRLRFSRHACSSRFIALYLGTEMARAQIELAATGASSSMVNIAQSTILDLQLALPTLQEQRSIIKHVYKHALQLDTLTAEARRAIDLLQERRTALISAAVTGQIDVRHFKPPSAQDLPKKRNHQNECQQSGSENSRRRLAPAMHDGEGAAGGVYN